jgi:hypothetical protein
VLPAAKPRRADWLGHPIRSVVRQFVSRSVIPVYDRDPGLPAADTRRRSACHAKSARIACKAYYPLLEDSR